MAKAKKEKVDVLAAFNKTISLLKAKEFRSLYLLEGEESYYIDRLLDYFDSEILSEEEKDFNLITLYGKDSTWADVVNACSRFPMFAEHTIVLLREAVQMKGMDELIPYFKQATSSTIFVIDYRGKDTNSKDKWANAFEAAGGLIFKSKRLDESDIPSWIQQYGGMHKIKIPQDIADTLAAYLGNDLQKITNELEKVLINEPNLPELTAELVEKHIGISRDYNFLDLPKVIFQNDTVKLSRMLNHFIANPKNAPLPPLVATFYTFADRIYRCYSVPNDFNNPDSKALYYYRGYASQFNVQTIHQVISLVNDFALKAVGIGVSHKNDGEILKEMVARLMQILYPKSV